MEKDQNGNPRVGGLRENLVEGSDKGHFLLHGVVECRRCRERERERERTRAREIERGGDGEGGDRSKEKYGNVFDQRCIRERKPPPF